MNYEDSRTKNWKTWLTIIALILSAISVSLYFFEIRTDRQEKKPNITVDSFTNEIFFFTDVVDEDVKRQVYTYIVIGASITNRSARSNTIIDYKSTAIDGYVEEKEKLLKEITFTEGTVISAHNDYFKNAIKKIKLKEFYKEVVDKIITDDPEKFWEIFNHNKFLTDRLPLYLKDGSSEKFYFILRREGPPPDSPKKIIALIYLYHALDEKPSVFYFEVTKQVR